MRMRGGAIEGAIGSGAITGILGVLTVEDASPLLAVIAGAILGAGIGLGVVVAGLFMPTQRWYPFVLVGGVIGAVFFGVATIVGIQLGDIINSSIISLFSGFIIGALIGGVVMRHKRVFSQQ